MAVDPRFTCSTIDARPAERRCSSKGKPKAYLHIMLAPFPRIDSNKHPCRQGGSQHAESSLAHSAEMSMHIRVLGLVLVPSDRGSTERLPFTSVLGPQLARCCSEQLPGLLEGCRDVLSTAARGLDKKADAKLAWLLGIVAGLLTHLPPTKSVATAQVSPQLYVLVMLPGPIC